MFVLVCCVQSDLFCYLLDILCVAFGSCLKFHQQEYIFLDCVVRFFRYSPISLLNMDTPAPIPLVIGTTQSATSVSLNVIAVEETPKKNSIKRLN